MRAVNYDLMYQPMVNQTHGDLNQIVYWSKLPISRRYPGSLEQ